MEYGSWLFDVDCLDGKISAIFWGYWGCVWYWLKKPTFFTIQLIFATIHGSHCTFWYYSWVLLYYFSYLLTLFIVLSAKSFQFQLNKLFLNELWELLVQLQVLCQQTLFDCWGSSGCSSIIKLLSSLRIVPWVLFSLMLFLVFSCVQHHEHLVFSLSFFFFFFILIDITLITYQKKVSTDYQNNEKRIVKSCKFNYIAWWVVWL